MDAADTAAVHLQHAYVSALTDIWEEIVRNEYVLTTLLGWPQLFQQIMLISMQNAATKEFVTDRPATVNVVKGLRVLHANDSHA